ncbi:ATP-binding protein [Streptomyces sp. NPDC046994]|uniref:ATP-binding protein n=1 Tax=Streptomyces sp. NPDC046994 TaxID=3155735 RepID=UPI003456D3FD
MATKLVNELVEAAGNKQLTKTIARYGRVDLPVIHELRYRERDRGDAELLFQVRNEREENASVERLFRRLEQHLHHPRLSAAIVDRLAFGGNLIETGTDSYGLAHTKNQQANG